LNEGNELGCIGEQGYKLQSLFQADVTIELGLGQTSASSLIVACETRRTASSIAWPAARLELM